MSHGRTLVPPYRFHKARHMARTLNLELVIQQEPGGGLLWTIGEPFGGRVLMLYWPAAESGIAGRGRWFGPWDQALRAAARMAQAAPAKKVDAQAVDAGVGP